MAWPKHHHHQRGAAARKKEKKMTHRYIVTTGYGLDYHSIHDTLEDALKCVHEQILRPRQYGEVEWQCQVTGESGYVPDGTITLLYWRAPDMDVGAGRRMTDWERTDQLVGFVGERVLSVSICREDRLCAFLARSGSVNRDTAERFAKLEAAIKSMRSGNRAMSRTETPALP